MRGVRLGLGMSVRGKVGVRNECEGQGWTWDNNWRCKNTTPIVIPRPTLTNKHNNKTTINATIKIQ